MLSVINFQKFCRLARFKKLQILSRIHTSESKFENELDAVNKQRLSRDQVLEIYDWIAQLKTQQSSI